DGLRLPLCLRHADRGRGARHLVHHHGRRAVNHLPILSIITFLPVVGALIILLTRGEPARSANTARWVALITTIVELALSLHIWANFDGSTAAFQFEEKANWLGFGIDYHMGVDGISVLFVVLTAGLMP